jgi:gluconolactonase
MPEKIELHLDKVIEDIKGAEGPVWTPWGAWYAVCPGAGQILRIDPERGTKDVHASTGGKPAGLQADANHNLWVADMKRGVLLVDQAGGIHEPFPSLTRGCNDLVFDPMKRLFVTAPAGSGPERPDGEVFCCSPHGRVAQIDQELAFPNGIAVDPEGQRLFVAETFTKRIWCYELFERGAVGPRQLFATLTGDHHGGPDGIDFDESGHLVTTNWGGGQLEVFDPGGQLVHVVPLPFSKPSNLHFGGEDFCDLLITEHSSHAVWKTRWPRPGYRHPLPDLSSAFERE